MCAIKRFGGQKVAKTNITTFVQVILIFVSFPTFMTLFSRLSSFLTKEAGWLHHHWDRRRVTDRKVEVVSGLPRNSVKIGRWFHLRRKNVDASLNFMAQRFGWSPWSFMRDVGWDFSQKRQSQFNARNLTRLQSTFSGKWYWYITTYKTATFPCTYHPFSIAHPGIIKVCLYLL